MTADAKRPAPVMTWPALKGKEPMSTTEAYKRRANRSGGDVKQTVRPDRWPAPLGAAAYYGLAGKFVRTIEPESEADPVGLLIHFLVEFGSVIGRGPHFRVEATRHGL